MSLQALNFDDLTQHSSAHPPRVRLACGDEQTAVETAKLVTLIGSRRDCDLYISNSDVSKVHCAVLNTGDEIIAADLGTRGGTYVNGQRITVASLHDGDEIEIASETVHVGISGADSSLRSVNSKDASTRHSRAPALQLTTPEQRYEAPELPAVIGRRHTCQIVLDTPDVSLAHALLFAIRGRPVIFDLGSRSGTYLNTQRVMLSWLKPGDCIRIGGVDLGVQWAEASRSDAGVIDGASACVSNDAGAARPAPENAGGSAGLAARLTDLAARETALARRQAELDALEARLRTRESELQQRENLLNKRESAHTEAACRLKRLMDSLGEARPVVGFQDDSDRPASQPSAKKTPPSNAARKSQAMQADYTGTDEPLPAPLVSHALFPPIGKK